MELFKCSQCGRIFRDEQSNVTAVNVDTARKVFLCSECSSLLIMEREAESTGADDAKELGRTEAED